MAPTVAVVGDALLDVTLAPSEPMRPGGDVPAVVRLSPGGQGANLAVRLARRGATVRLACGLGDDAAGRLLREALEADGVRVLVVPASTSGAVAILLDPGGERTMLSQRVAFLAGVELGALATDAEWLVISGYALLDDGAVDFARRCAALPLRRAIIGCDVPASRVPGWREALSAAQPDLVILNADEAAALVPHRGAAAADSGAALAGELGALVVVTEPELVAAAGPSLELTVVAAPLDRGAATVDTTGAGDAFAAALIVAVGGAWPPDGDALRTAMTAAISVAREVVAVPGAQASVSGERRVASS